MDSIARLLTVKDKCLTSARVFCLATTILLSLITTVLCIGLLVSYEVQTDVSELESIPYWKDRLSPEQQYWFDQGNEELKHALQENWKEQRARNVIIYIATGISRDALAATRFLSPEKELPKRLMAWDTFPHLGKLKNPCSSFDICDPFTVFTALLGGVRTRFRLGGLDPTATYNDCSESALNNSQVASVLQQAQAAGLRTGLVTNKRVTGPVAAALYAHTPNTGWECDSSMPIKARQMGCTDIATQLVQGGTGQKVNVIMGGGRQTLISNVPVTSRDPVDETVCNSQDNRNLMRDWRSHHLKQKHRYEVLQNNEELQRFNGSNVDFAMGIFANGKLRPMVKANRAESLTPQLSEMVVKALQVLRRKEAGYLLVVEVGVKPRSSIRDQMEELKKLNRTMGEVEKLQSDENTLSVVVFTSGDYVRSAMDVSAETDIKPNAVDFDAADDTLVNEQINNLPPDTLVYAKGPRSYLLHGVHQETYLSYVISYALQMGGSDRKTSNSTKT